MRREPDRKGKMIEGDKDSINWLRKDLELAKIAIDDALYTVMAEISRRQLVKQKAQRRRRFSGGANVIRLDDRRRSAEM